MSSKKGTLHKMTDEGRKRLSDAARGRPKSEATIQKWRESRKGYRHSKETIEKMKIAGKKRIFTPEQKEALRERMKGNTFAVGYKHPPEIIEKMKQIKRLLGNNFNLRDQHGANGPRWQGGLTEKNYSLRLNIERLDEYKNWRKAVFERDDYTCRSCPERGGRLQAHHIVSFMTIINKHQIETVEQARQCAEL